MRKVWIEFPGHGNGRLFNPSARDGVLQPFIYLRDRLRERGYDFRTADNFSVQDCAWILFWDAAGFGRLQNTAPGIAAFLGTWLRDRKPQMKVPALYEAVCEAGLQKRVALIIAEPPAVSPSNWDPFVHEFFPVILTWNDAYVDGKKYYKFHWPQTASFPPPVEVPFRARKLLVNISGNKVSSHPRELYSARRQTIRFFEQQYPEQFDLYGSGWNESTAAGECYPSYRGTVRHKWDVFPKYRFGLCYENMRDEPGWITEKIFDCMRAGSVPVYWGASNVTDFVAEAAFIDRRLFACDAALADFLLSMPEHEYNQYRQAIREYLYSPQFDAFLPPAFADTVIKALAL